jgi:hypothetical protein
MSADQLPAESQRRAFLAKLYAFRGSLDSSEQRMLDALVVAARDAHERSDVQVYWFTAPGSSVLSPEKPISTLSNLLAEYGW